MNEYIAFYGTLTSAHQARIHTAMRQSLRYVNNCVIAGRLYDQGRYPALKPGTSRISGELYKITDNAILDLLDDYEAGDDNDASLPGFRRVRVTLISPKLQAWVYYYDGLVNEYDFIRSGKWI